MAYTKPTKFQAFFGFRLSEAGRRWCLLNGINTKAEQIIRVHVTTVETPLFTLDNDGYLVGATFSGCIMGLRKIPRFSFLKTDIEFDTYPDDWRKVLHYRDVAG